MRAILSGRLLSTLLFACFCSPSLSFGLGPWRKSLGSQLRGKHSVPDPLAVASARRNGRGLSMSVFPTGAMKIDVCSSNRWRVQWCIARRNCRPPFIHRLSWEVERSGPRVRRPGVIKSRIQTPVTRHRFGKRPDCTVCGAREQSSVFDAHRHGMLAATLNSCRVRRSALQRPLWRQLSRQLCLCCCRS